MRRPETNLYTQLKDGVFITSAQIDPPAEMTGLSVLDGQISSLRKAGVNVVDLNARSKLAMDPIALGARYKDRFGFEVIPHLTPRDSTLFGIAKQVLTACATSDIRDFLIITGDPQKASDELRSSEHPNAIAALQEIDSSLRRSNHELDIALGAAFNQNARDMRHETDRTRQKITAGADFFMSQPVFTHQQAITAARLYRRSIGGLQVPLLMGIWPIASFATLEKIHNGKIEGVVLPADIYDEAISHPDDSSLRAWGEGNVAEIVNFIRSEQLAQGVYIVAPYREPYQLISFIDKIRSLQNPPQVF